jgi:hypothetical protein
MQTEAKVEAAPVISWTSAQEVHGIVRTKLQALLWNWMEVSASHSYCLNLCFLLNEVRNSDEF